MFCKKIALLISFLSFSVAAFTVDEYRSGQKYLEEILLNDETGMGMAKHMNPDPVETLNLMHDLCCHTLIKAIPCNTRFGHVYIEQMFKMPYRASDKFMVLAKQDFIKKLVENPALKNKFDELLAQAKEAEKNTAMFFCDTFKNERCPELAQLELLKREESFQYPLRYWLNAENLGRGVSLPISASFVYGQAKGGPVAFSKGCELFYKALGAETRMEGAVDFAMSSYAFALAALLPVWAVSGVYNIYRDYANAVEKRAKMNGITQLVSIARALEELCIMHNLECHFKMSDIYDEKTLALIEKLEHSRYHNESLESKMFNIIEVHTLAYDIYKHENALAPIFACIAEMDAYNAFATNIVDSYEKENKFCFVNFLEGDCAEINACGFWSMLVKNPVSNMLCERNHIVLTGPNAGGKSTTIRAIMQNILLGQCFGVAAAESFDFTMFDVLHSYLSITDNILSGESRFKAEVNRAAAILKKIETLNPQQKYFFSLDELFTGTTIEQGEKCAQAFIKRVAKWQNVQCIYATHFEKLKEMGSRSGSGVANYKVDMPLKLADGSLQYPFTISPGASAAHINVALDIAQQAGLFDEEIDAI